MLKTSHSESLLSTKVQADPIEKKSAYTFLQIFIMINIFNIGYTLHQAGGKDLMNSK